MTIERFELHTWLQQRVLLASTEEGRKLLGGETTIAAALAAEASGDAGRHDAPPPFDPETMSAAEVADWLERYGPGARP